jgi:hypothetical protein
MIGSSRRQYLEGKRVPEAIPAAVRCATIVHVSYEDGSVDGQCSDQEVHPEEFYG